MPDNETKEFVQALNDSMGAMAEMTMIFYNAALKHSADSEDAMNVTRVFLDVLLQYSGGKNTNG